MFSHLKYIYDDTGNKEAVIVPIQEWEKIQLIHSLISDEPNSGKKNNIRSFLGVLEGQKESLLEYLQQSRTEWD